MVEVLRGCPDERDASDVDLLDRFLETRAFARDRLLEGIQVYHHHADRRDAVGRGFGHVRGVVAVGEDRAEDFGV